MHFIPVAYGRVIAVRPRKERYPNFKRNRLATLVCLRHDSGRVPNAIYDPWDLWGGALALATSLRSQNTYGYGGQTPQVKVVFEQESGG
jgi:hypothetical protein